MIAAALASTCALVAVATSALQPPPDVHLAPVRCADLPDAAVRTPLRVELGERLIEAPNPAGDFLLLSIACDGPDATLLAVRQSAGAPVRRLVPLATVAPEARAREVALAAVELVRIADTRGEAPPLPTVESPASARAAPGPTITFGASALLLGGYLSGPNFLNTQGGAFRAGLELRDEHPPAPTWQWGGVAYELLAAGTGYELFVMNELLALFQYRGPHFVPELGLGGRVGWISKDMTQSTSTLDLTGGPLASAALGIRILPGLTWDMSVEGGYDLRGYGPWIVPRIGLTVHY